MCPASAFPARRPLSFRSLSVPPVSLYVFSLSLSLSLSRTAFLPLGPVEPASILLKFKAMYIAVNCASICLGLWKFNKMGLLPVTAADWVHLLPVESAAELAAGGAAFL